MSDDTAVTTDDEFDPEGLGVPTQRVHVVDGMELAKPSLGKGTAPQINDVLEVEVPDTDRIDAFLKGKYSFDSFNELKISAQEQRRRAIEKKSWQAIREIGQNSEIRRVDGASREFMDVMYEACHTLEQQAGEPENAEIFVHPKTRQKVGDWMDEETRLATGMAKMGSVSNRVQIRGYNFTFLETNFLEPGELVMADAEIHASPQSKPFVYVTNLPVGIEVTIKVDGRDNQIEVSR